MEQSVVSSDTSPEADRMQIELLRRATPARRGALAMSLSATVVELARRALRQQDPQASDEELQLRFVELHYGHEIAAGLRVFLQRPR